MSDGYENCIYGDKPHPNCAYPHAYVEGLRAERDAAESRLRAGQRERDALRGAYDHAVAERDETIRSQEFLKECADTPLMRDVMNERDNLRAQLAAALAQTDELRRNVLSLESLLRVQTTMAEQLRTQLAAAEEKLAAAPQFPTEYPGATRRVLDLEAQLAAALEQNRLLSMSLEAERAQLADAKHYIPADSIYWDDTEEEV